MLLTLAYMALDAFRQPETSIGLLSSIAENNVQKALIYRGDLLDKD
jgi:hypothetical protein